MDQNVNNIAQSPKPQKTVLRKRKFNFVDIAILLVLLTSAILLVVFVLGGFNDTESTEIEYVVIIQNVPKEDKALISRYNKVKDKESKVNLGEVLNVGEPQLVTDADGGEKYNIPVTIRTSADYKRNVKYTIDGYRIAINKKLDLIFIDGDKNEYAGSGLCYRLEVITDK